MIDLYTYRTSNGRKVSIMLEECGLPYSLHVVDITAGEQQAADFLAIGPNGRIPAIVDRDGPGGTPLAMFESGAILLYLAEKCGRFLAVEPVARWTAIQWLMWQMGGVGPGFGQAFHFLHQHPDDAPEAALAYGRARYGAEVRRLIGVLDARLAESAFLGGEEYGIADIATFPWVALHGWLGLDLDTWPGVRRWYADIRARPAVRRGMDVPSRARISAHAAARGAAGG
ncbi:MAG: glutathione S-transferase N-terminal domain-containing protein [Rhodospirillaceae bacterium]